MGITSVSLTGQRDGRKLSDGVYEPIWMVSVWTEDEDGDESENITSFRSPVGANEYANEVAAQHGLSVQVVA